MFRLIDGLDSVLRRMGNISAIYNGGRRHLCDYAMGMSKFVSTKVKRINTDKDTKFSFLQALHPLAQSKCLNVMCH